MKQSKSFPSKSMANKSKRTVQGVGIKGDEPSYVNDKKTKAYTTWSHMLERCYSSKCHQLQPTYIGCTVCKEWLYYPSFKRWFDEHYVEGWQLDKDLLIDGNKEYGPDVCIFVPSVINTLFTDRGRARGEYPIGVCFHKQRGKFLATLNINGKQKHIGLFNDPQTAHQSYLIAKKAYVLTVAEKWRNKIPYRLYEALIRKAHELIQ